MATDLETLVVRLEAQMKGYDNAMRKALGDTDKRTKAIETRFTKLNANISKSMALVGNTVRGALAGFGAGEVMRLADSYTKVQNSLRVAGLEGEALKNTYDQLFAAAQRQSAPIEAMATLYGRLSMAQKELNVTAPELMRFTEGVATALRVSGTSATEAQGALLQLSQALSGGKVQAEEYNSLIDGARPVLQAVATGLVEAGGSVAKLTALVKDGKVSSEAFFRAFEAGQYILDDMGAKTAPTASQSLTKLWNVLTDVAGKMDEAAGASEAFQKAINWLSADLAKAPAQWAGTVKELELIAGAFNTLADAVGKVTGIGEIKLPAVDPDRMARATPEGGGESPLVLTVKPKKAPVSLSSFPVPGDKDGKSKREKESEFAQELKQIKERTAALQQEASTVGQSAGEVEKARVAFELLKAAKESNLSVDAALKAQIDSVAAAYGTAVTKLDEAEKAIRDAQYQLEEFQDIAGEGVKGFVHDLLDGANAAEALQNALKRVGDRLLDMALDSALKGLFSGSGSSGLGGLFSSLFGGARASGGPVQGGKTYLVGENGPEMVRFGRNGTVTPNSAVKPSAANGNTRIVINNNNASEVSQSVTNGPMGPEVRIEIDRAVADAMRSGSATRGAMRGAGINRMR